MIFDSFRLQYLLSPLSNAPEVAKLSMVDECIGSPRWLSRWGMESHRKAIENAKRPVHLAFLTISLVETSPDFA